MKTKGRPGGAGKGSAERKQPKPEGGSGVNKPVKVAKVPTRVATDNYRVKTQHQKS